MKNHPLLLGLLIFSAAAASVAAQDVVEETVQDTTSEAVNEIVVNVSNIEKVWSSNITLFERDSSPEVRNSSTSFGVSIPSGTSSVMNAWAVPQSVQYTRATRRPPIVSFTSSCTSMMFFG